MRWMIFAAVALLVVAMDVTDAGEPSSRPTRTFYCSPQGADSPQAGAKQNPWKTIDYALGRIGKGGGARKGQEAHTLIAISNLFVNTTGRGAITFVGATRCLVADNIFVNHDDRRTGAVAIYTNYPGGGITNDELFVVHNVFYDARGRWKKPIYAFEAARPTTWLFSHNLYWNGGKAIPKDHWHDPSRERGALFKDPLFSGDLGKLVGRPSSAWFDILRLRKDSPFRTNAVQLEALSLPHELRQFLDDYRHGRRDPWYRQIQQR